MSRLETLLRPDELEAELRAIGAARYHNRHPFHALLHGGKLTAPGPGLGAEPLLLSGDDSHEGCACARRKLPTGAPPRMAPAHHRP